MTLDSEKKEAISQIIQLRPDFKEFFKLAVSRQRNRGVTEVDSLVKNTAETGSPEYERRKLVIELLRKLEEVGVGEFRIGRRKQRTRFIWNIATQEIAHLATLASESENEADSFTMYTNNSEGINSELKTKPILLTHKYILRSDFFVNIDLPVDFTKGEADRLSAFIQTLPIEIERKL